MPIGGTPQMREEGKYGEKIVRPKEKLVWWYMKTSGRVIEVCIEIESRPTIQNCSNVHKQEKRE